MQQTTRDMDGAPHGPFQTRFLPLLFHRIRSCGRRNDSEHGSPIRHLVMPRRVLIAATALAIAACAPATAAEQAFRAPAAERISTQTTGLKTAIFAGGCFWGVEAVFSHMKGVTSAVSGYHGGNRANATYRRVSSGVTGHAEAVKVIYDPAVIRYDQLLRVFFSVVADPTLKNRQGPDVGAHYRAALVPVGADQHAVAAAYLAQMSTSGVWAKPIVTRIEARKTFYSAEQDHQDFARKNPRHPYIRRWDAPKVAAFKRLYPGLFRTKFVTG